MNLCNACREPMPEERIARCEPCCLRVGTEGYHSAARYGSFEGGDPRNFTPDPEACSDAQHAAWEAACVLAKRDVGARDLPPSGRFNNGFTDKSAFGLGVTHE